MTNNSPATAPGARAAKGQWLSVFSPNPSASVRLFCFPYAGGGAQIFRTWARRLPAGVEVCPVQPPGRGSRMTEPPFRQLAPLVEALAEALRPHLDRPFAFFGHSMGAMISFELARLLREQAGVLPFHMFVSGRRAPHIPETAEPSYDLPYDQFVEVLRRLNGTPEETLRSEELMALMVPLLRADFSVCQTYAYAEGPPLACPITAFGGADDGETAEGRLEAWREQTTGAFSSVVLPGDHFFLHTAEERLLRRLGEELHQYARRL
jgi:medium-chain acyl-[acyl-carrier-protein] hydrolase